MRITNNVKRLRQAAGMTQAELAARLGITTPSITKWEKGRSNPDLLNVFRMKEIFECSVNDIICQDTIGA